VAIVDTRGLRNVARLQGRAHHLGRFQIDDQRGNRLLDLRTEFGFPVDLWVPAGEPILLSNESGETTILARADHPTNLEDVLLEKAPLRARSAMVDAMRRGLFAAEFGPSYYGGFVDSADKQMVPVELSASGVRFAAEVQPRTEHRRAAWSAFAVAGVATVAAGVFAVLAGRAHADFESTNLERPSIAARDRYESYGYAALGTAVVGALSGALGYWLWHHDDARSAN
jgi:hypothetical protein